MKSRYAPVASPSAAPADQIKTLYLMVDGNPSPLAGTFHFGPAADPHSLKTRVRVDQYTLMHAVAETTDGRLFVAERFVKAAGGCSAPSLKDPKLAMSRMGQMRLRVDTGTLRGWWRNRFARVFVNFVLANAGTSIAVWVAGANLIHKLR